MLLLPLALLLSPARAELPLARPVPSGRATWSVLGTLSFLGSNHTLEDFGPRFTPGLGARVELAWGAGAVPWGPTLQLHDSFPFAPENWVAQRATLALTAQMAPGGRAGGWRLSAPM